MEKRFHCDQCGEFVLPRLYYSPATCTWITSGHQVPGPPQSAEQEEFSLSASDEEETDVDDGPTVTGEEAD